ncbi:hypothetical protein QUB12_32125 [Microcoleus sp. B7-D4]|uniref:hypothetical protein n=1 Tax=Microcoleus sp. AR_TQ3_B6 TaxID=3055284 RepID=UPI002FD6F6D8
MRYLLSSTKEKIDPLNKEFVCLVIHPPTAQNIVLNWLTVESTAKRDFHPTLIEATSVWGFPSG